MCLIQSHLKYESAQTGTFQETHNICSWLQLMNVFQAPAAFQHWLAEKVLLLLLVQSLSAGQSHGSGLELMEVQAGVAATVSLCLEHLPQFFP